MPELQPPTNGNAASEFTLTKEATRAFVVFVIVEAVINAAMQAYTGHAYDAVDPITFGIVAAGLVGSPGIYTAARTSKKNTLAKVSSGVDPAMIKKIGESIVAAAKGRGSPV